jgi:hypothetical protein
MRTVLDPFINKLQLLNSDSFLGVLGSAPATASNGQMYINSGNDTLYIYYAGMWQAILVLAPGAYILLEDGGKIELEATSGYVALQK